MTEAPPPGDQLQSTQEHLAVGVPLIRTPDPSSRVPGIFKSRLFNKIATRIFLWTLCLALVPVLVLVGVSLDQAKKAIHDEALRKLISVASDRHSRLEEHLRQIKNAVHNEGLERFVSRTLLAGSQSPARDADALKAQLGEALRPLVGSDVEVFIADSKGLVVESTNPNRVGYDCSQEEYFLRGRHGTYLSDKIDDSRAQWAGWMVSAPVVSEDNRSLLGVLISCINPRHLNSIVGSRKSERGNPANNPESGFQGRVYLVKGDGRLLTDAAFFPDSLVREPVDTKPVQYARDKRMGMCGDYFDTRRVRVIGASEVIPELHWTILAEMDYDLAMAPYTRFRNVILVLSLVVIGLVLVLGVRLGSIAVRPLQALVRAEERLITDGDSAALVPEGDISDDEIGALIRRRNEVIQRVTAAEKRHRDLVEEIDGIAWEAEVGTWRFTFVNRRAEQILGYPADLWLSEPGFWVRHLHPLDRSRTVQAYLEASITGKDLRLEYRMMAADGHPVWLRDQAHLVTETCLLDGRPVRQLRGLMIDITAAQQAQDLLQDSERRSRTIIDMSRNAIIGIDIKGSVSVFNHAAEQMFQISAREIIGESTTRLVPEDLRDQHLKAVNHYLGTGRLAGAIGQPKEMTGLRNDGSVFPMEIMLTPTNDKSIRVLAAIQDITARKKADEELQYRYRQLDGLHQLTDALIHAETIDEIYGQAMSCVRLTLGADRASIVLSDPDGPMRFKAWDGLSERYRAAMEGRLPWSEDDPNPRTLLNSDVHAFVEQVASQPTILSRDELTELRAIIVNEGIGAMGAVPLVYQSRLLGRLMVYFDQPHVFSEAEVQFAQTIAAHVAFAIGRQRANDILQAIIDGASPSTGAEFFRIMVRHLASALHVRWAFAGESTGPGKDRIRILALWAGNDYAPPFEYDLAGTPCEGVIGRAMCCYPSGVAPMFPQDPLLTEMGVESYLGVRLSDSSGESLGILVVMHDGPLSEPSQAESILRVFAARASAELERLHTEDRLRREQQWYAAMSDQIEEAFLICAADTGRVHGANKALLRMLGFTPGELQLMTMHDLVAEDRVAVDHYLSRHVNGAHHTIEKVRYHTKTGSPLEVETTASAFVSDQHPSLFIVVRRADRAGRQEARPAHFENLLPAGVV